MIVGLGNPGRQYDNTPHNVGYAVIDSLARRFSLELRRSFRFHARVVAGIYEDTGFLLAKPNDYMNVCGPIVEALVRRKGFGEEDLIVISDDASLPEGRLRIRASGSSGGHNGLNSVIASLGHDRFARVRLGIGPARAGAGLKEHVLTPFPPEAAEKVGKMVGLAAEAVLYWMQNGIEEAMNMFNKPMKEGLL